MNSLFGGEDEPEKVEQKPSREAASMSLFPVDGDDRTRQSGGEPIGSGESIRGSGLAFSAGIVFFGSVIFTLILGWFADTLFGTSPWGIVGGIVLGSLIGFIQFFRLTSQIFRK